MPPKPSKLMPALYGGIIMAVISSIPVLNFVNACCCAGVMLGGFLAVFFYQKDLTPETPLTGSDGVLLGALAGVFGAVIGTIFTMIIFSLFGNVTMRAIYDFLNQYRDQIPPESFDQIERAMSREGLSAITLFFSLIIDTLFGLVGGAIGYAVFKPKTVIVQTTTPPPPTHP